MFHTDCFNFLSSRVINRVKMGYDAGILGKGFGFESGYDMVLDSRTVNRWRK